MRAGETPEARAAFRTPASTPGDCLASKHSAGRALAAIIAIWPLLMCRRLPLALHRSLGAHGAQLRQVGRDVDLEGPLRLGLWLIISGIGFRLRIGVTGFSTSGISGEACEYLRDGLLSQLQPVGDLLLRQAAVAHLGNQPVGHDRTNCTKQRHLPNPRLNKLHDPHPEPCPSPVKAQKLVDQPCNRPDERSTLTNLTEAPMTDIEMQAITARIDRDLAESAKMREETNRMMATMPERYRLESQKLVAEIRKMRLDPWMVLGGAVIAGIFLRLPEIIRLFP